MNQCRAVRVYVATLDLFAVGTPMKHGLSSHSLLPTLGFARIYHYLSYLGAWVPKGGRLKKTGSQ